MKQCLILPTQMNFHSCLRLIADLPSLHNLYVMAGESGKFDFLSFVLLPNFGSGMLGLTNQHLKHCYFPPYFVVVLFVEGNFCYYVKFGYGF